MIMPLGPQRVARYGPTMLYRFFDVGGRLLYVGVTGRPQERWVVHRREAEWWTISQWVTTEWHPTMRRALAAEREAIRAECPQFNLRGAAR